MKKKTGNEYTAMKILTTGVFAFVLYGALFVPHANAVDFSFTNTATHVYAGDKFAIILFADTKGEDVNAMEGTITYPASVLSLSDVNISQSVISLWAIVPKKNDTGAVSFSGAIPGGYSGLHGEIVRFTFTALKTGSANIGITNYRSVKNDGLGTVIASLGLSKIVKVETRAPLPLATSDGVETQTDMHGAGMQEMIVDTNPPEPFTIYATKNPSMYDGKWFAVANIIDKESSLAGFYIYETRKPLDTSTAHDVVMKKGKRVDSLPYVLEDQSRKSYVYVCVHDAFDNAQISTLLPAEPISTFSQNTISILYAGIVSVIFALFMYIRQFRRRTKKEKGITGAL